MEWVTTQRLQREFALPKVLAGEIVAEQLRAAVRYRWQPWVWLAGCAVPVLACWFGWLPWNPGVHEHSAAVWLMILAVNGWAAIGRWLAGPGMLTAAAARAHRLQHAGEDWMAYERATSTAPSAAEPASNKLLRP